MPRPLRLILPGVAVHIIQRGNNRSLCFGTASDYLVYLAHLRSLSAKYGCDVHAYCLMTNHVHLLVTPKAVDACTVMMRDLGQRYVQYFNRRHDRTGTLWEGRFRSCLVESSRYVLACYRYVELNPVRAHLVAAAGDYPWSSHATNIGTRSDSLVSPHPEVIALAADPGLRHAAYRTIFASAFDPSMEKAIRESTNGGYPLASDAFKTDVIAPLGGRIRRGKPGPRSAANPELGL